MFSPDPASPQGSQQDPQASVWLARFHRSALTSGSLDAVRQRENKTRPEIRTHTLTHILTFTTVDFLSLLSLVWGDDCLLLCLCWTSISSLVVIIHRESKCVCLWACMYVSSPRLQHPLSLLGVCVWVVRMGPLLLVCVCVCVCACVNVLVCPLAGL